MSKQSYDVSLFDRYAAGRESANFQDRWFLRKTWAGEYDPFGHPCLPRKIKLKSVKRNGAIIQIPVKAHCPMGRWIRKRDKITESYHVYDPTSNLAIREIKALKRRQSRSRARARAIIAQNLMPIRGHSEDVGPPSLLVS